MRRRQIRRRSRLLSWDEIRNHRHRGLEPALLVHLTSEETWRDESIYSVDASLEQMRISPPLGWSSKLYGAAKAFRFVTEALIVFPKHMHGTNEPVFVCGIELDEIAIVRLQLHHIRTEQRNIVIMDDVELLAVEDFENFICLGPGTARLLRDER